MHEEPRTKMSLAVILLSFPEVM
uniref:Uncharacterized protein n=1 Tax=Rhizophora mucronata TaxID=61149 RepID=A0A2P2Q474_RHIMU